MKRSYFLFMAYTYVHPTTATARVSAEAVGMLVNSLDAIADTDGPCDYVLKPHDERRTDAVEVRSRAYQKAVKRPGFYVVEVRPPDPDERVIRYDGRDGTHADVCEFVPCELTPEAVGQELEERVCSVEDCRGWNGGDSGEDYLGEGPGGRCTYHAGRSVLALTNPPA